MGAAICCRLVSKEGLEHDGHEKLDEDNEAYFDRVEKRNKVRCSDEKIPKQYQQNKESDAASNSSVNAMRNRAAMLKHAEEDAIMRQTTGLSILPSLSTNSYISTTGSVLMTPSSTSISSALSTKSTISAASKKHAYSPLRPLPAPAHDSKSVNSSVYSVRSAKTIDTSNNSYANNIPRKIVVDSSSDYIQQYVHFEDDNRTILTTETGENNGPMTPPSSRSRQNNKTTWSEGLIYANITRRSKITALAWDSMPGSPIVAIGCEDGSVVLVNVEEHCHHTAAATIQHTSTSLDSPSSKSSTNSSQLRATNSMPAAMRQLPSREGKVRSMSFSPIHRHLAIGGEDCTMIVLDLGRGDITLSHHDDAENSSSDDSAITPVIGEIEREDRIHAVEYSPSGQYIAVAGFDGMCAIVNASTMELVTEITRSGLILCVAWHPSGSMIAIGGSDKEAAVLDTDSWEVLGEIQRHGTIQCLSWSPQDYNTNNQRNTTATKATASWSTSENSNKSPRSSNEKEGLLAVGGSDGKVAIIDMDTKSIAKEVSLFQLQHQQEELRRSRSRKSRQKSPQDSVSNDIKSCRVNSVSWCPDGSYISICGSNGVVIIVETRSFAVVQEVIRTSNLTCIAWQPMNGKYLTVGGDDHTVAVLKTGIMVVEDAMSPDRQSIDESMSKDSIRSPSGWVLSEDFEL